MSYGIGIYHPSVRARVEGGEELDAFTHHKLDAVAVTRFVEGLAEYGYQPESATPASRTFVKDVSGTPIQVHVFSTEIACSIPYWETSKEAIFEALQDAAELVEPEHMCIFDQQSDEWLEAG